jgi:hypothetical protein
MVANGWDNPMMRSFLTEFFAAMKGQFGKDTHSVFRKYRDLGLFKNDEAACGMNERMIGLWDGGHFDKTLGGERDGSPGSR